MIPIHSSARPMQSALLYTCPNFLANFLAHSFLLSWVYMEVEVRGHTTDSYMKYEMEES